MARGLSFALICGLSTLANAVAPYSASWSSTSYGPDGPWNAVLVQLGFGNNKQSVALYPGDRWASTILLNTVCSTPNLTGSSCLAESAGTYNVGASRTAFIPSSNSNDTSDMTWVSGTENVFVNKFSGDAYVKEGQLGEIFNIAGASISNVSVSGIYEAYQTYPNGKKYPVEVGTLALGAPALNQTVDNGTYRLIESYLWENGQIPSYSWGMHIGSVAPSIAGSLVMGGYDQARAIGNVSSQPVNSTNGLGTLDINLFDIGLGVAMGKSPWKFNSMNGLFRRDNSSGDNSASVQIDPTRPYLYLPKDTCDAIAEQLPVSYNEGLGLYIWNTSVHQFEHVTNSPAYLSFTFENNAGADASTPNITIKVPFNILKLTLQAPLVEQNTTYFPCHPSDEYVLGRAFLQAAFLGTNWMNGTGGGYWFFAQAPGPNLQGETITTIQVTDTTVVPGSGAWEDSWSGWWHVIPHGGGLSQGAKIGIGIGCGVAGALAVCLIGLLVARCMRKKKNIDPSEDDEATELATSNNATEVAGPLPDTPDVPGTPDHPGHAVGAFEQANVVSNVSNDSGQADPDADLHGVYGDKPPPWSPPLQPLPGQMQSMPGHSQPVPGLDPTIPSYDNPMPGHPQSISEHDPAIPSYDNPMPGHDQSILEHDPTIPSYDNPMPGHVQSVSEHDPTIPSYDNPMPGHPQSTSEHGPTIPSYDNSMPGHGQSTNLHHDDYEDAYNDYIAHIP
ncbi:hypothetical protein N7507_004788 [Penicillium longicatenatum]|nr:hypothetical protein N7507_004788 [Penicillium longicatenatum]